MEMPTRVVANGHTVYTSPCNYIYDDLHVCTAELIWQPCDTGGWWHHDVHPADGHDAQPAYYPPEDMNVHGWWITMGPGCPKCVEAGL